MEAPDFPRRPLADKFLYRALVRVNAYKCAKFQLPSSISYGDIWRGSQNKKWALLLLVCVSFTIIGQPRNSVLIRRV